MYVPSLATRRFPAYVPAWMERIFGRFLERGEIKQKNPTAPFRRSRGMKTHLRLLTIFLPAQMR